MLPFEVDCAPELASSVRKTSNVAWAHLIEHRSFLWKSGILVLLVFLSEALHLVLKNPGFIVALGAATGVVILCYAGLWLTLTVPIALALRSPAARSIALCLVLHALLSIKALVIDSSFLHHWKPIAFFSLATSALFAVGYVVESRVPTGVAFPLLVLLTFNAIKWLGHDWARRGGGLKAFLFHHDTILVAGVMATCFVVVLILLARRPEWGARLSWGVVGALCLSIFGLSATGAAHAYKADLDRPDILILSFDALRKDVFDTRCKTTRSPALQRVCARGRHFENVFTPGVSTYQVLPRIMHAERDCAESMPGRLGLQGYTTSMYLGRRMVNIRGSFCFQRYFAGENGSLLEGFALPSVGSALLEGKASGHRRKLIDSRELFAAFRDDPLNDRPLLFAYLHLLDLHAPYVPSRWSRNDAYLEKVQDFESRCITGGCDLSTRQDRELVESMRSGYLATLDDVEARVEDVFRYLDARKRPYRVVLTADHGELFGEHGGLVHSGGFVPELLSVPFVVYDSNEATRGQDCRLLATDEAMHEAVGLTDPTPATLARSKLAIDGSPLGKAVVDVKRDVIDYSINDGMRAHRGTWRNLHALEQGSIPFASAVCN